MHFIQENAFENVVCEMVAILSRSQCANEKSNTKVFSVTLIGISDLI